MIIVTTATAKEMKAAFSFADIPAIEQGQIHELELGGRKLLLAVSGVGLVNAAICAGGLMGRLDVTGVVNLGIAGAYDIEEFPLGSSGYVWQEVWPEYGLLDEDGNVTPKDIGFPQGKIDGKVVWDRVKLNPVNDAEKMGLPLPPKCGRAASVSVSSVTGTAARAGWLKMACNGDLENMEGFAVAFAAKQRGLPFLEIRSVSNVVGSRFEEEWDLKAAFKELGRVTEHLFTAE